MRRDGLRQRIVTEGLLKTPKGTREVADHYGVTTETAWAALDTALQAGEIRRDSTGHGAQWYQLEGPHWAFTIKLTPNPPKVFGERCYRWE